MSGGKTWSTCQRCGKQWWDDADSYCGECADLFRAAAGRAFVAPAFVGLTPPPPNPNATGSCHCGAVTVHFDEVAGAVANAKEVRAKWPRGRCGTCGTTVYASTMHFIAGDW